MADPSEPDADGTTPDETAAEPVQPVVPAEPSTPSGERARRGIDRRTVAIAATLGVIAAIVTVLVASALTSDDSSNKGMVLTAPIDSRKVLSQPLETLDGKATDLGQLQDGKPMLVNLWQSTCSDCVYEMPMLNDAKETNPGVTFLGVATLEPSLKDAKALAKQTGITYPWVLDNMGGVFYEAAGQGMPTTILITADGTVIDSHSGKFTSAKQLQAFIDQVA